MTYTIGTWVWSGDQLLAKREMHSEPVLIAVGEPFTPSAEDKALIAAAPDMLAALKSAVDILDAVSGESFVPTASYFSIVAAITKAETP